MTTIAMRVKCPRCNKIHEVPQGIDEVDCDCHLYCPDGDKPTDCTITKATLNTEVGWPVGLHNNPADEGEDVFHRTYYCSVHKKYYYKTPIIIPVDWSQKRLPKDLRWHLGNI